MSDLLTDMRNRDHTDKHCPFCGCRKFDVTGPATQDFNDTQTEYLEYDCGSTQKLFEGESDGWLTYCVEFYRGD